MCANKHTINSVVCVMCMCFTSRSDSGVLSPSGKCCSRASTMQLAMMVVKIIHSNGVRGEVKAQNTLNLSNNICHNITVVTIHFIIKMYQKIITIIINDKNKRCTKIQSACRGLDKPCALTCKRYSVGLGSHVYVQK